MLRRRTHVKPQLLSGKYQTSGNPGNFISSDYGKTWTRTSLLNYEVDSLAISQNGAYILTTGSSVFISSDYGKTFNTVEVPKLTQYPDEQCVSAAISRDGQYMVVSTNYGGVVYSRDYGQTWIILRNRGEYVKSAVSMSANGQYVLAVTSGIAEISSNHGVKFSTIGYTSVDFGCLSTDGMRVLLKRQYGNQVYVSSDYGVSGVIKQAPGNTYDISTAAMSGDGRYIMVSQKKSCYLSSDYGNTWSTVNFSGVVISTTTNMAISEDGRYMICGTNSSGILISSDYGVTWENRVINPGGRQNQHVAINK